MKHVLRTAVDAALLRLRDEGLLPTDAVADYQIEVPKNQAHGDFSTNAAMAFAKISRKPPRELAGRLAELLGGEEAFRDVTVAGPGFVNFILSDRQVFSVIDTILAARAAYGRSSEGRGRRVQVEFVSANPTGPLHIGHGRGAAIGSVVAALLAAVGYDVSREYYVNDAGRQMDILGLSVYLRYVEACGGRVLFPKQAYQGAYVRAIADRLKAEFQTGLVRESFAQAQLDLPDEEEREIDELIERTRSLLGQERFEKVRDIARDVILAEIRDDLAAFGVEFDVWYSETSLVANGHVEAAIERLAEQDQLYSAEGARWFRSSAFGDEKDRVVVRENGAATYFASDIAYHLDKFQRGFDCVVNVWGADHHGYVPRVRAALEAVGLPSEQLDVVLVQFAALVRGGEHVAMSTRSGEFVTLRSLVDEVGLDAARFFYVMRRADQHLDFDLDLATARNNENPVYYVQYAHARIASVLRQSAERGLTLPAAKSGACASLDQPAERQLALRLAQFPETLSVAAQTREPHHLTQYLRDLATEFHAYYNAHRILVDDPATCAGRLALVVATQQVLANGLGLLGIQAPDEM